MRAGDGDAAFQPHQFGQHFGAAHHRQALGARGDELRIVALDGGRDDDDVGAVDIFRLMADGNLDALVAQPLDVGAVGDVRTGYAVTEIGQHLGDAAHADAADADEMHRTDVARQFHEVALSSSCRRASAMPTTRNSGLPELRKRVNRFRKSGKPDLR